MIIAKADGTFDIRVRNAGAFEAFQDFKTEEAARIAYGKMYRFFNGYEIDVGTIQVYEEHPFVPNAHRLVERR